MRVQTAALSTASLKGVSPAHGKFTDVSVSKKSLMSGISTWMRMLSIVCDAGRKPLVQVQ